jgi:hypothetical protein
MADEIRMQNLGRRAVAVERMTELAEEIKTLRKAIASAVYAYDKTEELDVANILVNAKALKEKHGQFMDALNTVRGLNAALGITEEPHI